MEIKVAKQAGFCFGVKNAVDTAYKTVETRKDTKLYMLGELTHNDHVVKELIEKGFILIDSPRGSGGRKLCSFKGTRCYP